MPIRSEIIVYDKKNNFSIKKLENNLKKNILRKNENHRKIWASEYVNPEHDFKGEFLERKIW